MGLPKEYKETEFLISCPHCGEKIQGNLFIGSRERKTNHIDELVKEKIKSLFGKMSDKDIAFEVGVASSTVSMYRSQLRIERYNKIRDDEFWKSIDPLFEEYADIEIMQKTGILYSSIHLRRKHLGKKKLSKDERRTNIIKIFQMHKQGFTFVEIANVMRLTRQRIEQIINTKNEVDYLGENNATTETV